jgi:hypothetical protein
MNIEVECHRSFEADASLLILGTKVSVSAEHQADGVATCGQSE